MAYSKAAIGLYAVLDRDLGDFLDMLPEADFESLQTLYLMLSLKTEKSDNELNEIGARMVAGHVKIRFPDRTLKSLGSLLGADKSNFRKAVKDWGW